MCSQGLSWQASIHSLPKYPAGDKGRGVTRRSSRGATEGFVEVHITWVTDAGVDAPVVAAVAVLGADVGVAGVGHVAAVFHADLQTLGHVHVGHVGRRLAHTDTLTKNNCKRKHYRCKTHTHTYTHLPVCSQQILCWHGCPLQASLQHKESEVSVQADHSRSPLTSA